MNIRCCIDIYVQTVHNNGLTKVEPNLFTEFHFCLVFQALNEISEGEGDLEHGDEELGVGSLLR